jgi:putative two-component system response regulator
MHNSIASVSEARRVAEDKGTRTVLVVDDDDSMIGLLSAGLSSAGFRVLTAFSVEEGGRALRRERVDMVVCDYEMPGHHGTELLAVVNAVYPHLPFIMLTGYDSLQLARESIRSGAIDFLTKPCKIRDLIRHMEQAWERLERDQMRLVEATKEVLDGAIMALVTAIDAKDPHTATHSQRVTELAGIIGDAAGLSPQRMGILRYSALLHDVGKIAIPESILLKPGPLNDEEWAVIKLHPCRSAEVVRQVPGLEEVATVVRHHHERLDGSGYPDGLAGDAIPFLSRILTLADVYEAVTADRSYRPAMTENEAREILRSGWGTAFDPTLGALFDSLTDLP